VVLSLAADLEAAFCLGLEGGDVLSSSCLRFALAGGVCWFVFIFLFVSHACCLCVFVFYGCCVCVFVFCGSCVEVVVSGGDGVGGTVMRC
jgi:hypothetical protein